MAYAGVAIAMWGLNGLFMKLGTNRVSARSMVIWVTVGFLLLLPFLGAGSRLTGLGARVIFVGLLAGAVNALGNWAVFACLEKGAKASVAIPLTALYPLCTIALSTVFLHERPSTLQWLGIGLALAGGAMLSYETVPSAVQEEQIPCPR
jgi:drug/metabolite transporter (DMT)-like permease